MISNSSWSVEQNLKKESYIIMQVGKFPSHLRHRPLSQVTTPILALLIGRPFKFSVISMPRENSSAVRGCRSIRIFFDDRRKKESGHSRRGFLSRETRERGELCKLQHRNHQPSLPLDSYRPTHLCLGLCPFFQK